MPPTADPEPGAARPRPRTPRVRLARLAADATLSCPGVLGLDPGPRDHWCTFADDERLPGVVVMADEVPGRYAVTVYLRVEVVDLRALAGAVREAVRAEADRDGLTSRLGTISVAITEIDDGTPAA